MTRPPWSSGWCLFIISFPGSCQARWSARAPCQRHRALPQEREVHPVQEADLHEHQRILQARDPPGDSYGVEGRAGLHLRPRQRGQELAGDPERREGPDGAVHRDRDRGGEDDRGA